MTFKKLKYYSFFLSLLLIQSCTGQTDDKGKSKIWKSKYFEFSLEFTHPWTQLPSFDTSEKSLFGVMDYNDGKSYIVKIVNDVSKDILSDSIYFDFAKNTILSENDSNILLDELDTMYHGEKFHCMTFELATKNWTNS